MAGGGVVSGRGELPVRVVMAEVATDGAWPSRDVWAALRTGDVCRVRLRPDDAFVRAQLAADWRDEITRTSAPSVRDTRLLAHAMVAGWLGSLTHQPATAVRLRRGPHGKPRLDGAAGVEWSVSMRPGWFAIAISTTGAVGIDLELPPDLTTVRAVSERFFAPEERVTLCGSSEVVPRRFAQVWTRKEALGKAAGVGVDALRGRDTTSATHALLDDRDAVSLYRVTTLADAGSPIVVSVAWQLPAVAARHEPSMVEPSLQ